MTLLDARNADRAQRAWLHLRLGLLLRYTDPPRARAALEEAQRLSAGTDDALLIAATTCYAGHLRCWSDDLSGGVTQIAEGVAALEALPPADRARFARLLADGTTGALADNAVPQAILAQWLAIVGRYAEARQAADAILATDPGGDPARDASAASFYDAYHALGYVNAAEGRPDEARRSWHYSQNSLRTIGHHVALHQQLYVELSVAVLPYQTDRLPERARLASEVDAARRAARGVWRNDDEPACLALWFIEGRWAEIRGAILAAASLRPLDVSENPAVATLAWAQGDVTLAWRLLWKELPHGPETPPGMARRFLSGTQLLRLGAKLTLDANDPDAAYHWLETHDRWLAWSGAVLGRAEGDLTWASLHRTAGDPAAARRHAEQALAGATTPRQPLVLLAAHRFLGELDMAAGRYVDAERHLAQSLALADACAAPYERALTLLGFVELRIAAGSCDAARPPLTEARARFTDLEARPALARAEALAATLDQTALAAIPLAGPAGLTAREIEVLRLVTRGLSNRQVAEQLSLSPRTVNSHLTTIYSKLGVSSRGSAIRFALDHNIR